MFPGEISMECWVNVPFYVATTFPGPPNVAIPLRHVGPGHRGQRLIGDTVEAIDTTVGEEKTVILSLSFEDKR